MRKSNTEEKSRAEPEERHLFTLLGILNSMVSFIERTDMTSTDMRNNCTVKLTELPFQNVLWSHPQLINPCKVPLSTWVGGNAPY